MSLLPVVRCAFFGLLSAVLFAAGSHAFASGPNMSPALTGVAEGAAVEQALDQIGQSAGDAGVLVVALPSGDVVCESRAKEPFVTASLMKLLTSYTALKKLGPSFRFTTKVLAERAPVDGVIAGDIWIKGSGDPQFVSQSALQLASALKEKGIREIRGSVFVDNSFFQPSSERICLDSECKDLYNPVISAAAVDFNILSVKVAIAKGGRTFKVDSGLAEDYVRVSGKAGPAKRGGNSLRVRSAGADGNGREDFLITGGAPCRGAQIREFRFNAADPGGLCAHAVRAALKRSGAKVLGTVAREGEAPPEARTILSFDSAPLSETLCGLNRYSNNFMAEMLLRSIGGYLAGAPGDSGKGIAVIRTALREAGIPDEIASLDCGSGLSRFSRVSPETFCRLLVAAWNDNGLREEFISSMAVNGENGTLKRRMLMPGLTVRGKTGTLKDVVGFAGYLSGPSGKSYAAAIILNGVKDRFKARQAVDCLIEQVAFLN